MQDELSDKNVTKKKKKNLQICLEKAGRKKSPKLFGWKNILPVASQNYFLKSTSLISDYLDQSIVLIISTNH